METLIILIGAIVILSVAFYMAREKSYLPPQEPESEVQTQTILEEEVAEVKEEKSEETIQSIAKIQEVSPDEKQADIESTLPPEPVTVAAPSMPKEEPVKVESEVIAEKPVSVPPKQDTTPVVSQSPASTQPGSAYTVQVGYFSNEANARSLAKEIENRGFQTFVIKHNNAFKVQVGAYSVRAQAEEASRQLKNLGYEIWLTER